MNGTRSTSSPTDPGRRPRVWLARALAVGIAALVVAGGLATGSPAPQSTGTVPLDDVAAACNTTNPFLAMACVDDVAVFQDTRRDDPHYTLGRAPGGATSAIGAIWGLAASAREGVIYAAAVHRRGAPFGPGGPGAVYRIDLLTGAVTQPIAVPNAGVDRHGPDVRGLDASAAAFAAKTSLGDIDLSDDETELFVTNLNDRRIYRFSVPSGAPIGSFAHGAASEPWAGDARPWAVAVRGDAVYHGVVHSAESVVGREHLRAVVFASAPDGGGMRRVLDVPLDYERPRIVELPLQSTKWSEWRPYALGGTFTVQPMPIVADIDFEADGAMVIGLKDRLADMGPLPSAAGPAGAYGLPLGDVLRAPAAADGWGPASSEPYLVFRTYRTRWAQGGLATLPLTPSLAVGATHFDPVDTIPPVGVLALWYPGPFGEPARLERLCGVATVAAPLASARRRVLAAPARRPLRDNGETPPMPPAPAAVPGDVERVCFAPPGASATPSTTPSPAGSRTPPPTPPPSASATSSATSSAEPTVTRTPGPVYLPIAVTEPICVPVQPRLDVVLVIDASTSMRDPTRAGRPKIDAAVAAARDFVARLDLAPGGDHAAVVAFNAASAVLQPLTDDRTALASALDRVALAELTRIDLGLDAATAELTGPRRRADATSAVVLLTDGRSNPVPVSEAERAAGGVKAAGARLFTIGLGQDVDREALERMASGPGDYYEAPDGEDLAAIYRAISAALPCPPYAHWPR